MSKSNLELKAEDFVHLHNHTHFSVLDGLTKIPAMVSLVKEYGMRSVAITDHGTMSGAIEFYKDAKAQGIKPIIGMEAYVAARTINDRDVTKDKASYHLTLLAQNETGYRNLMRLATIACLEGFYYRPRIDFELLKQYHEGLIVLSGCIGGELGDKIRNDQLEQAEAAAIRYQQLFKDSYYLEIQDHGHAKHPSFWAEQQKVNEALLALGAKLGIPCVLTCDAHYLRPEDKQAHEILLCVQTGSFLSDTDRMSLEEFDLHLTGPEDVISRWGEAHPELILNSRKIADSCDLNIRLGDILIPKFPVPKGQDEQSYLHQLVWQGLAWRYGAVELRKSEKLSLTEAKALLSKEIVERAEYEMGVINDMGFNGYFLIVQDFIKWGKDRGIVFGPGRGSAAGSIVSYGLRITEIEPLRYNLMFERFLNPNRISMPDIDIDIQDTRRDEVIAYCVDKYGKDRVANIVTYGRMAARNAVRDVARVLQVPYSEADRLAKLIPPPLQGRHIPLAKSLKTDVELAKEYKSNETARQVFDLAMQLEGTIRSHGVHAAGVVIAPDVLYHYSPLEMAQKGVVATQYAMGPIEELGLLKMDFLGLSNLTILKNALRIIKKVYKSSIALEKIPIDDAKTFELLRRGDTTGVFQLESAGMRRYLKELKPNQFEDIIAMNALYRPGPMAEIPRFIEGKNNSGPIAYLHQSLEPVLKDTYGVMVYQEQITNLLQLVAGYTPGEADLVRKAIGKKKRDIMEAEQPRFIEGCLKQGLSRKQAEQLWAQIQPFADYSFNKAHATCYAQIAYWTAYLKAHYPAAFMAALMTSDYDNTDRLAVEITECQKMGIPVLPPDLNQSFAEFAVIIEGDKTSIRFGLNAVKNVGSNAVDEILKVRTQSQFASLEDFLSRIDYHAVNRKSMESLIKAGAFDRYGRRVALLDNLDLMMAFASKVRQETASGQTDLFGSSEGAKSHTRLNLRLSDSDPNAEISREQLQWERELLGLYLSQHPLSIYVDYLRDHTTPIASLTPNLNDQSVTVGGIIKSAKEIISRKGQKMAFVTIEDFSAEIEVILFPSTYQQTPALWAVDKVVLVRGKLSNRSKDGTRSEELKLMADDAREISTEQLASKETTTEVNRTEAREPAGSLSGPGAMAAGPVNKIERVYIRLISPDDEKLLLDLKSTIDDFKGKTEVVLVLGEDAQRRSIKLPYGIDVNSEGPDKLRTLIGTNNVAVK